MWNVATVLRRRRRWVAVSGILLCLLHVFLIFNPTETRSHRVRRSGEVNPPAAVSTSVPTRPADQFAGQQDSPETQQLPVPNSVGSVASVYSHAVPTEEKVPSESLHAPGQSLGAEENHASAGITRHGTTYPGLQEEAAPAGDMATAGALQEPQAQPKSPASSSGASAKKARPRGQWKPTHHANARPPRADAPTVSDGGQLTADMTKPSEDAEAEGVQMGDLLRLAVPSGPATRSHRPTTLESIAPHGRDDIQTLAYTPPSVPDAARVHSGSSDGAGQETVQAGTPSDRDSEISAASAGALVETGRQDAVSNDEGGDDVDGEGTGQEAGPEPSPVGRPGTAEEQHASSSGTTQDGSGPQPAPPSSSDVPPEAAGQEGGLGTGLAPMPSAELEANRPTSHGGLVPSGALTVLDPDDVPTVADLRKLQMQTVLTEHQTIRTPMMDTTQYAAFKMRDLGLAGFVAADNTQETGAFAVSVGCGYFHDPPELPGLAHMLEHMIFLGSSSRPQATAWDEFISSKGGLHNAHTKPDITTFYVSAPTQYIPELLDVFLQHLFKPALVPEQVQSEAMAVQYEHEKNTPDLERVALHIALNYLRDSGTAPSSGSAAKPVSAKFGTGSLETLCNKPTQKGINMLESMRRFHQKCYVPSNMSIALRMGRVKGEENQHPYRLWDVVDLITARFRDNVQEDNATFRQDVATDFVEVQASSTPREAQSTSAFVSASAKENGGTVATEPHNISATEKVADENELPPGTTLRLVRAHGWRRRLFVFWSAPSEVTNNLAELECQPSSVVQYLLEHPMEAGLLATLKQKGYISKGEAFKHWTTRSSIMGLALDTTDKGESNHDELMSIVRQFTNSLQSTVNEAFVREHYANYGKLSQLLWKFQDPLAPLDQVVASAEISLQYPSRPDMTLNTGVCISAPAEGVLFKEVRRLVEAMAPGREVVVKLQMTDSYTQELFTEVAEYGVKYLVESSNNAAPDNFVQMKVPQPLACKVPEAEVQPRPPPSVCASSSARLPTLSGEGSDAPTDKHTAAASPCVLLADDNISILWHNGAPFNKPIVRSFIKARVAETEATARNDAFGKIFTLILAEHAKLKLSAFHGCGVDLVVAYTGGALVFELQSFTSIFEEVTQGLGAAFQDTLANVTEEEFNLAVAGLKETTNDFSASTSYEIAVDVALSIVRESRFSQFDLKEQLLSPELTFANFKRFISGSMGTTAVDCFLMGDIDASKARELALGFVGSIRTQATSYGNAAGTKTLKLTSDVEVVLKNPITADVNHAFVSLYVSEPPDILESVLYSTIGDLLRAPFFDTVRTINMDGYVASASVTELPPVAALGTIIQSSLRTPTELEQHVCTFLYEMTNTIGSKLTKSDFEQRLQWIARSAFAREQSNFAEFFSGVVSQISPRSFCFIKAELAAVASQSFVHCPESLKRYLTKLVMGPSRHRITVKLEAATPDRGSRQLSGESQCTLPGQRSRPSLTGMPLGIKRTQDAQGITAMPGPGKQRKGLVEHMMAKVEPGQKVQADPKTTLQTQMQYALPAEPEDHSDSEPTLVHAATEAVKGATAEAIQLLGGDPITTTGASADAELPITVTGDVGEEETEAAHYCADEEAASLRGRVTLTNFAERPQEERQRLLSSLLRQLEDEGSSSGSSDSSQLWMGYDFDKYCTVREATVRNTTTCSFPEEHHKSIIQEDDSWVQLANGAAENGSESDREAGKPSAGLAVGQRQPAARLQLQEQVAEQQHQLLLVQRLQHELAPAAQREASASEFLLAGLPSPRAPALQQQVMPHNFPSPKQTFPPAQRDLSGLNNAWFSLQQQQQQYMQPRVAKLRRYGSLPSVVFTSPGGAANAWTSDRQRLFEGAASQYQVGLQARQPVQMNARQLQLLRARREAVEQHINYIQQRLILRDAAAVDAAAQA